MPRQPRLDILGASQHVVQVGATDSPIFARAGDCQAYLEQLLEASHVHGCEIHAYALAASRVQLLVTGRMPGAVAGMMRRVGLAYARYANARDGRRGTCWRGRYLSCPVGGDWHVLLAYGHIERSLGTGYGASSGTHLLTSHACNAHGSQDPLITPHPAYLGLGTSAGERLHRYREVLAQGHEIDEVLAMHTRQGRAWGSDDFLQEVAAVLGAPLPARARGRPRKALHPAGSLPVFFLSPFLLTDWMSVVETL